jgi:outer membrane murein-binding lipoprotein Lpp
MILFRLTLLGIFLLSGCSTLSKQECLDSNWFSIGNRDGMQGRPVTRLQQHGEACKEYNVTPNAAQYEKGRNEGLTIYCTPENGLKIGRQGVRYEYVCPKNIEQGFLKKYEMGSEIHRLEGEMANYYHDIQAAQEKINDPKTSDFAKRGYQNDITRYQMEKDRIQRELTVLEMKAGS